MHTVTLLCVALGLVACGPSQSAAPTGTSTQATTPGRADSLLYVVPSAAPPPDSAYWRAYYEGEWTGVGEAGLPGLACGRDLSVRFDDTPDPMCVVANQIWITVRWTLDAATGVAHLLLVDPHDVGRLGSDMPWRELSRTHPLATLEPTPGEGRYATLVWHGFPMSDGQPYGDDYGDWLAGDYEPADSDTRLPGSR